MTQVREGIHTLPDAIYHADPCPAPSLSNSLMKTLLGKTPSHAWHAHPRLNPAYKPYHDDKFDPGTVAHAMLLEGGKGIVTVDAEDWRSKDAKAQRDIIRAEGMTAILARQWDEAQEMAQAARVFLEGSSLAGILADGKPEQTVVWQEHGAWCRAKLDWLTSDRSVILDYKTTSTPNPAAFMRWSMHQFGYDTQDAFYRRGIHILTSRVPDFVFLVQEDTAPFACYLVQADTSMREVATHKITRGIDIWRHCVDANSWPAYEPTIYTADAQAWAIAEEEAHVSF